MTTHDYDRTRANHYAKWAVCGCLDNRSRRALPRKHVGSTWARPAHREEILVRLDRAATKLLALASTVGVIAAITVTSAAPAGASTAATSSGPRLQAIVALYGDSAVSVPGLHVQSLLGSVHSEIVDGTAAQLAQLATTPGVLGVEPNVAAHLESDSFGASPIDGKDERARRSGELSRRRPRALTVRPRPLTVPAEH